MEEEEGKRGGRRERTRRRRRRGEKEIREGLFNKPQVLIMSTDLADTKLS